MLEARRVCDINLELNGREVQVEGVPVRRTLLELLRNDLSCPSVKNGCDEGCCGLCTILLDGIPVYSCLTLAINSNGKKVTTLEGLGSPMEPHPIQKAFAENYGSQCGYCTPGMILTSKALLDRNPNPSVEEIKESLAGVICRCNLAKIVDAISSCRKE